MYADPAGQLMMDELGRRGITDVIDPEAAVSIGLPFRGLDRDEIDLCDTEFLRQFGSIWLAPQ